MRTTITELNSGSMNKQWSSVDKWTVGLSALAIVVVFVSAVFYPEFRRFWGLDKTTDYSIAGRVVDDATGASISGAVISVVGRTETVRSESNGNFTLKIKTDPKSLEQVRLEASKPGYQIWDQAVVPPQSAMMISLKRE